ncbi:MAG TPA: cytochrome d ubiquinol oxidase subunit II [Fermentimonas sp.]|nr:cytochrome d ubiquinol oxidase subunit II [Fermentimonas sp.]
MITYEFLQQYWWIIMSLLGGLLVFLMFVQGGQSMLASLSREESEKRLLVNALGRKWEYTFTTLVVFGGAFFAAFPLFYSTSFGGAYWAWMIMLFSFVMQAVSYEFQSKPGNIFGAKTYRVFLFLNGLIGTFLLGVVVASFFTGSEFTVGKANIAALGTGSNVISQWQSPLLGLELLGNVRNIALGLAVLFLSRTLASLYFVNRLDHEVLEKRSRKFVLYNGAPFVVFFLIFVIWTLFADGYAVDGATDAVYMEKMKYLNNFIDMPLVGVLFLLGVVAVLYGIVKSVMDNKFQKGIWFTGAGTVVTVMMLLINVGFNNTAYYPSSYDLQSSLTIYNSSSSHFTLSVMAIVSLLVPVVIGYIIYAWGAMEKKRLGIEDVKDDGHVY